MKKTRKGLIGLMLCITCVFCGFMAFIAPNFKVSASEQKAFTVQPTGSIRSVGSALQVKWEINFEADEFNILYFDVNIPDWDQWDIQAYKSGVNTYAFTCDEEIIHKFKIQALIGGECVLESEVFQIEWTNVPLISFLPNGGSGEMPVQKMEASLFGLPNTTTFTAPEGKRLYGWEIDGEIYPAPSTITVTKSVVATAVWKKEVQLPIVIDGSSLIGKKYPSEAKLGALLQDTEEYYFCDTTCCNIEVESDEWYDSQTNEKASTFEDGKYYYYRLGIHPRSDYMLPSPNEINKEEDGLIQISGVAWLETMEYMLADENRTNNTYWVQFVIIFDQSRGITAWQDQPGEVLESITIDGSYLVGLKEPKEMPEELITSEYFYPCGDTCDCGQNEFFDSNSWQDISDECPATSFINGKQYAYCLLLHLKEGYVLPDSISEDYVTITGVTWAYKLTEGMQNICLFMGSILYNEETGVPGVIHECELDHIKVVEATCTQNGKKEYYRCKNCYRFYEDAEATLQITEDIATWGIISTSGHQKSAEWSYDKNGHWIPCVNCTEVKYNEGVHIDSNANGSCDICGYKMVTEEEPKGLSGGAIAGIVVGSIAVAGIGGFAVVWFVVKKKSFADLIAIFKKR